MSENKNGLKREIGLWGLSTNLINIMIGGGIFVFPAIVAAGLGSAAILAYLFCGFLITLVMLSFAEVGSRITRSGGVYTYIEDTFGKYPGFIAAVLFVLSSIAADAAIANAIIDVVSTLIPVFQSRILQILFLLVLFSGLAYINVLGVSKGVRIIKIIIAFKLIPLLLILLLGSKEISINNLVPGSMPTFKDIGEISLILFFAFQGAEAGLSVNGEVQNPRKTIPKAIRYSIISVLTIYILVQLIAQGVLGASLATFQENPLGEVASHLFGSAGFTLLTIGAAVSMFGTLSSIILSIPRVLFAASSDGVIPIKKLSLVHKKYATPYISIISYASLGFIFAIAGGFKQLAIISSASVLLIYLGVSFTMIKLRRMDKQNTNQGVFRVRGGYLVPLLSSFVIVWFLSHLPKNELMGIGFFIAILSIVYLLINSEKLKQLIGR